MNKFDYKKWYSTGKPVADNRPKGILKYASDSDLERVRSCIQQLKDRSIDLTADYNNWVVLGLAFTTLGSWGRDLFHELSSICPDYDYQECDKKYDSLLKASDGTVTIATFFKQCADVGIKPKRREYQIIKGSVTKPAVTNNPFSDILNGIMKLRHMILERLNHPVAAIPPLLTFNGQGAIWKNAISVVMGQKGSHKSRLCEGLFALLLNNDPETNWIGFAHNNHYPKNYYLLYVDTERPVIDQYPFALKGIMQKAGLKERPENFDAISMIMEPRKVRFKVLQAYLEKIRSEVDIPIVVVIDVLTDLTVNFNNLVESLALIDWLNLMINKYDVTVIGVIHENPGLSNTKARGHLGTEIGNKASTELRISSQKGNKKRPTDLVRLEFPKVRAGRPPESVYLIWSDEEKGLALAADEEIAFGKDAGKDKAAVSEIVEALPEILAEPLNHSDFAEAIKERFGCGISTAKNRISELMKMDPPIKGADSNVYRLRTKKDGKLTMYFLERIPETGSGEVSQS